MRRFIIKALSTFFYVGYFPLIPGTMGTAAGMLLLFLIKGNNLLHLWLALFLTVLGFAISGPAENVFGKKDSRHIVIDEAAGICLAVLFLPGNTQLLIIAFLLFRVLDAIKPYPADKIQNLKGSLGVMGDDIIAAIYTNIVLQIVCRFTSFKVS